MMVVLSNLLVQFFVDITTFSNARHNADQDRVRGNASAVLSKALVNPSVLQL